MSIYDLSAISLISAPAANALSEPVRRMQPTLASASHASTAPRSSFFSVALSAFSACGRLKRMMPTRPRRSTIMVSVLMTILGFHGARARKVQGASQGSRWLSLTDRTKKCRPAALHHAPDRAGATWRRAGLAGTIIDAESVLKITEFTVSAAVIAQGGAARRDRLGEHCLDRIDQPLCTLSRGPGSARLGESRARCSASHT